MNAAHPGFGPDQREFLADQCSRLRHGRCTTVRCLKRGGWRRNDPRIEAMPYDEKMALATCEAYEIHRLLDPGAATSQDG